MAFRLRPEVIDRVRQHIAQVLAEQGEDGAHGKGHVLIDAGDEDGNGPAHHFEVRGAASAGRYYLTKGNVRVTFDALASDRWALVISFTGAYWLGDPNVGRAQALATDIARAFGWCDEKAVRLRRIDLAADVAGYDIRSDDISSLVKPRRGRIAANDPFDAHDESAEHWYGGQRLTGITVCKGGDVQAVIYDKTEELERVSKDKAVAEKARWRERWPEMPEGTRVTRVEVRLRGDALREFTDDQGITNYRDQPWEALKQLDRIWAYATGSWLRLVVVDNDRISRCKTIDPRWSAVQSARFVRDEDAVPAVRLRVASKADVFQTFGTAISSLVATESPLSKEAYLSGSWIDRLPLVERDPSHLPTDEENADAEVELHRVLQWVGANFAVFAIEQLQNELGSHADALRYVVTRIRAVHARHASFDELNENQIAMNSAA